MTWLNLYRLHALSCKSGSRHCPVGDAVDGIGPVVADNERAILHLQDIHRPPCGHVRQSGDNR